MIGKYSEGNIRCDKFTEVRHDGRGQIRQGKVGRLFGANYPPRPRTSHLCSQLLGSILFYKKEYHTCAET